MSLLSSYRETRRESRAAGGRMIIEERAGSAVTSASARGWLIWGTAALFYLYEFFVRVAPAAMEEELQAHFGLTAAALGAAAGAYYFIYSPMQLVSGTMIDRFGAKRVLLVSVAICTFGVFIEVAGSNSAFLVAARFCQGMGSAFAFVGTMYLAAAWFPRSMLALLSGLTTSLGMAGAIIGNAGVARLVDTLGWQTALLITGALGIVIGLLIALIIPAGGSAGPVPEVGEPPAERAGIVAALRVVYANPQSWYIGIVGASLYMPLSILGALWGESYIAALTGADKIGASGAVSMMYVGWMIGGPLAGFVSDRFGTRRPLLVGASIATVAVTAVIALLPSASLTGMYALLLLLGLASTSQVVCFAAAVEHNPARVTGTAIAATNMMIMLLGGLGEWGFGELLDLFSTSANPSPAAFRAAIWLLPAVNLIGLLAALRLTEHRAPARLAAARA